MCRIPPPTSTISCAKSATGRRLRSRWAYKSSSSGIGSTTRSSRDSTPALELGVAVSAASTHSVRLILNTALWLTALGVVVRASGAIKEIIFAGAFGVSRDTDAFVLAVTYATFLPAVLGGAIATALVAHLSNVRAQGSRLSSAGLASMLQWISIAGVVCAILIYLLAPVLLAALFSLGGEQLDKAVAFS